MGLVNSKLLYDIPLEDYDALESKVLNISVQQANEGTTKIFENGSTYHFGCWGF